MQRYTDPLVFGAVNIWACACHRRLWRKLRRRQKEFGVTRVNIATPRLANEKFFWRKVFDHDPRFVLASDKIASKEWVKAQGINVRVPETLWTGTDANNIPDALWQRPIYIKSAHGWRTNIPVLSPPDEVNRAAIIEEANSFLTKPHGVSGGEWSYAHVPRRLLVEQAIIPTGHLIEAKYFTYGKIVERVLFRTFGAQVASAYWSRQSDGTYCRANFIVKADEILNEDPLPRVVLDGIELASKIGDHFDHMRIDSMIDGDKFYLGELTVYSSAGRVKLDGDKIDDALNRSWDLRRSWFLTTPQKGCRGIYAAALRRALDRRAMRV